MIDIVVYYLTETPAINGYAATTITTINTLIARLLISFDHAGAGSFIHSPSLRFINYISIIAQTAIPPNNTIDRLSPLTRKWAIDHVTMLISCGLRTNDFLRVRCFPGTNNKKVTIIRISETGLTNNGRVSTNTGVVCLQP